MMDYSKLNIFHAITFRTINIYCWKAASIIDEVIKYIGQMIRRKYFQQQIILKTDYNLYSPIIIISKPGFAKMVGD